MNYDQASINPRQRCCVTVSQPAKQYTLTEIFGLSFEEQAILQFA